jgi:hypothetical protein
VIFYVVFIIDILIMTELSSTIQLSTKQGLVIDVVVGELIDKLTENNQHETIPKEQFIFYLCSLVLDHISKVIKDNKITSDERVELIIDIICVLLDQLPLDKNVKNFLCAFIEDGEIKNIIKDLDERGTQRCMGCFGKLFRACIRTSNT